MSLAKDFAELAYYAPRFPTTDEYAEIGCFVYDNRDEIERGLRLLEMVEADAGRPVSRNNHLTNVTTPESLLLRLDAKSEKP